MLGPPLAPPTVRVPMPRPLSVVLGSTVLGWRLGMVVVSMAPGLQLEARALEFQ